MARAHTAEAKDLRRAALLEAALDEFFQRGFTAARMDDIAARAGVSKGALYVYFDSKDALFKSLVEVYAVPNVERLESVIRHSGGGLQAIGAMLRFAPTIIRETPVPKLAKILIADAPAFPDTVTAYRKNVIERVLGALTAVLEEANAQGEIEIDNPSLTARLVAAPIIFSAIWRVVFEHDPDAQIDLDALFALHEKMLLQALAIRANAP